MSITRFMSDIECIVCYTLRCCMDKSVWTKVSGQECLYKRQAPYPAHHALQLTMTTEGTRRGIPHRQNPQSSAV